MGWHRSWWAVLAAVASISAACGADGAGDQATPATGTRSSPALADVRAAAEAVKAAGTGRFELSIEIRGIPDSPNGILGTKYGTYDISGQRLELRWVLPQGALRQLQDEGTPVEPVDGTREHPHVVSLWSEAGGLLVRVPIRDQQKWVKLSDVEEAGAAQFGINLAEATAAQGPPLIGALLDPPGPAATAPGRPDDPPDSRRYTVELDGGSGIDLLASSAFLTMVEALDAPGQKQLLATSVPAEVLLGGGHVLAVDVDLKPLMVELFRLSSPGAEADPAEVDALTFAAHARFSDAGAPVDIPEPGPEEIVSPEEAGMTVED